jgi:hypothetical protein
VANFAALPSPVLLSMPVPTIVVITDRLLCTPTGRVEGCTEGWQLGFEDGWVLGWTVGCSEGLLLGCLDGCVDGLLLG